MPRLRAKKSLAPSGAPVTNVSQGLPDGVMARCTQSHVGPAGFIEKGWKLPLDHAGVRKWPEVFELCGDIPAEWRGGNDAA
jgi:hypothetical protein